MLLYLFPKLTFRVPHLQVLSGIIDLQAFRVSSLSLWQFRYQFMQGEDTCQRRLCLSLCTSNDRSGLACDLPRGNGPFPGLRKW